MTTNATTAEDCLAKLGILEVKPLSRSWPACSALLAQKLWAEAESPLRECLATGQKKNPMTGGVTSKHRITYFDPDY